MDRRFERRASHGTVRTNSETSFDPLTGPPIVPIMRLVIGTAAGEVGLNPQRGRGFVSILPCPDRETRRRPPNSPTNSRRSDGSGARDR